MTDGCAKECIRCEKSSSFLNRDYCQGRRGRGKACHVDAAASAIAMARDCDCDGCAAKLVGSAAALGHLDCACAERLLGC